MRNVSLTCDLDCNSRPLEYSIIRHFLQLQLSALTFLTPWSEPASELYRPSDRRLSAK
jgi:hypothetical protein